MTLLSSVHSVHSVLSFLRIALLVALTWVTWALAAALVTAGLMWIANLLLCGMYGCFSGA
jgi:hypothetical protein